MTAPETHPIFGATSGSARRPGSGSGGRTRSTVREFGAGTGALAAAHRSRRCASVAARPARVGYDPVEATRRATGARRPGGEPGSRRQRPPAIVEPARRGRPIVGTVLANEVLDALPAHRVRAPTARFREALRSASTQAGVRGRSRADRDDPGPGRTPCRRGGRARRRAAGRGLPGGRRLGRAGRGRPRPRA